MPTFSSPPFLLNATVVLERLVVPTLTSPIDAPSEIVELATLAAAPGSTTRSAPWLPATVEASSAERPEVFDRGCRPAAAVVDHDILEGRRRVFVDHDQFRMFRLPRCRRRSALRARVRALRRLRPAGVGERERRGREIVAGTEHDCVRGAVGVRCWQRLLRAGPCCSRGTFRRSPRPPARAAVPWPKRGPPRRSASVPRIA